MKMFGKRRIELPNEVRMQYSAPSFSFYIGKRFEVSSSEEVESILKKEEVPPVVLLYPGIPLLENPKAFGKALLAASYIVIFADKEDGLIKSFLSRLERQIFSPVPKTLAGAIVLDDEAEAGQLLLGIASREKRKCITLIVR